MNTAARLSLVGVLLALVAVSAHAQTMVESPILAQALLKMGADGSVEGCGLRLIAIQETGEQRRFIDSSLNIYSSGHALAKITAQSGKTGASLNTFKQIPVAGGWFRALGGRTAIATSKIIDGDSPGSKLFATSMEAAADTLIGAINGDQVQVSVAFPDGLSVIYFGAAKIDDGHKKQVLACMKDLEDTISKSMK